MNRAFLFSLGLAVVALCGAVLSAISGLSFWWAFLIVAVAIFINGWIAALEDDLPGGFNNSEESDDQPTAKRTMRVLGLIVGAFFVAGGALILILNHDSLSEIIAPLSMVGLGGYFVHFGLTGRSSFNRLHSRN